MHVPTRNAWIQKMRVDHLYEDLAIGVSIMYQMGGKGWLFRALALGKARLLREPPIQFFLEEWTAKHQDGDKAAGKNLERLWAALGWV